MELMKSKSNMGILKFKPQNCTQVGTVLSCRSQVSTGIFVQLPW